MKKLKQKVAIFLISFDQYASNVLSIRFLRAIICLLMNSGSICGDERSLLIFIFIIHGFIMASTFSRALRVSRPLRKNQTPSESQNLEATASPEQKTGLCVVSAPSCLAGGSPRRSPSPLAYGVKFGSFFFSQSVNKVPTNKAATVRRTRNNVKLRKGIYEDAPSTKGLCPT